MLDRKMEMQIKKEVDGVALGDILINSIKQAFDKTEQEIKNNLKFITRNEYIRRQKEELNGLLSESSIETEASNEYYNDIEKWIKARNTITKEVYESLEVGQKFHFDKHYNFKDDKVI